MVQHSSPLSRPEFPEHLFGPCEDSAPHVLVIEDDPIAGDLIELHLRRLGYASVEVAHSTGEALIAIGRREPGLLIADIVLDDGTTGVDVVHRILQRSPIPVVFLSAQPQLAARESYAAVIRKSDLSEPALAAAIAQARGRAH